MNWKFGRKFFDGSFEDFQSAVKNGEFTLFIPESRLRNLVSYHKYFKKNTRLNQFVSTFADFLIMASPFLFMIGIPVAAFLTLNFWLILTVIIGLILGGMETGGRFENRISANEFFISLIFGLACDFFNMHKLAIAIYVFVLYRTVPKLFPHFLQVSILRKAIRDQAYLEGMVRQGTLEIRDRKGHRCDPYEEDRFA